MKTILLKNKGSYALLDDEDYERFGEQTWHENHAGYAVRRELVGGRKKTFYLHRLIAETPQHLFVDHINRNRLDNRKSNLRNVSWEENRNNISVHKDNLNGQRNIDYVKRQKRFRVRIQRNKQVIFVGMFPSIAEAITKRDLILNVFH